MERRSFLGTMFAVAVLPWTALKRAAGYVVGWRMLRQKVGAYFCEVRYRWLDHETVEIDWLKAFAKKSDPGSDAPFPCLVLHNEHGATCLEWKAA